MPDDNDHAAHEAPDPERRSGARPQDSDPRPRPRGEGEGRGSHGRDGHGAASHGRGGDRERRLAARAPSGRAEPAGIERARKAADAPPRLAGKRQAAPPRPALPDDEEPHLPRAVRRDIDRLLGPGERSRDVALALSVGSDAIDAGRVDVALEALRWAKHLAPRVAAVREAYGVARYLDEDYSGALTELQAYRRITGRTDQNHVIADCLRGLGRDLDRVAELAEEVLADSEAPSDRRAEAVIVWAAALADDGQLGPARALLRRHLGRGQAGAGAAASPHDLRVLVLAAELAERDGDLDEARAHRDEVAGSDPDLLEERAAPPGDEGV